LKSAGNIAFKSQAIIKSYVSGLQSDVEIRIIAIDCGAEIRIARRNQSNNRLTSIYARIIRCLPPIQVINVRSGERKTRFMVCDPRFATLRLKPYFARVSHTRALNAQLAALNETLELRRGTSCYNQRPNRVKIQARDRLLILTRKRKKLEQLRVDCLGKPIVITVASSLQWYIDIDTSV